MGISEAAITNWTGVAPDASQLKYVFTVTEAGTVDTDGNIVVTDGPGLGVVQQADSAAAALNSAMLAQDLSVYGGILGSQTISVADGGDAERSAASIAQALNGLEGVTASAFENSAVLDITNLVAPTANTQANDFVSFTLLSSGRSDTVSFRVGAFDYETRANFQDALNNSVAVINDFGSDLTVNYSGNEARITSASGENISIENFDVQDLPVATLDNFQNLGVTTEVDVDTFTNFANGETVDFTITTAQGSVNVTYTITDDTDQTTLATDFETGLNNSLAALTSIGVTFARVVDTVTITGDASAGFLDFQATTATTDGDESFDITTAAGTSQYPAGDNNVLLFDGTYDLERYAGDNSVSFTVNADNITVDLRRVDTTSASAVASAFFNGLDTNVANTYVTNLGSSVSITATDELAADFSFTAGSEANLTNDASFDIAVPGATPLAADTFSLDGGVDSATFTSVSDGVNADSIAFEGATITETGGGAGTFDSALKTATLTMIMEPGYAIQSNVAGGAGGIFNFAANISVTPGTSILTLGGDGGYSGFDIGNRISFSVDGTFVDYIVGLTDDTDVEWAIGLEAELNTAGLDTAVYSIHRHGSHVSIIKNDGTDIELTNFADDGFNGGTLARLEAPANTLLIANNAANNSASSRQFTRPGVISWEKFLPNGKSTRDTGQITISDAGIFEVESGGLAFSIGAGSLVAGNTFTLNTNNTGQADSLQFRAGGTAKNVYDIYKFTVEPGSTGVIGADDITISWSNNVTSGSFVLKGKNPPFTPVTEKVDGMTLQFDSGTLIEGDVFTITTDANGSPTENLLNRYIEYYPI